MVLSQYDDPEYAVSLLAEGSAGYGYLLKDRVAEGNQLADAIRSVATGGTALDPAIVEALVRPVVSPGELAPAEEELLGMIAEGKPIKAIAAARRVPPEAVDAEVEAVFVKLAAGVASGSPAALNRLRLLHQAIVDREEQGETLSQAAAGRARREAPGRQAAHRRDRNRGRDRADERHQVLLDHRRARRPEPAGRAAQHAPRGHEPCHPRRGGYGDAVRRRRGDGGVRRAVPAGGPR